MAPPRRPDPSLPLGVTACAEISSMRGAAIELEDAPGDRISRTRELRDGAARVLIDRASPKGERSGVSLRHADGPAARKAIPGQKGGFSADSRTAIAAKDEEFGNVKNVMIVGGVIPSDAKWSRGTRIA